MYHLRDMRFGDSSKERCIICSQIRCPLLLLKAFEPQRQQTSVIGSLSHAKSSYVIQHSSDDLVLDR
jgi:hypothetical protein